MAARHFSTSIRRSRRRMYERVPAKVPDAIRQQIDAWADAWLKTTFTRAREWRAANHGSFNAGGSDSISWAQVWPAQSRFGHFLPTVDHRNDFEPVAS